MNLLLVPAACVVLILITTVSLRLEARRPEMALALDAAIGSTILLLGGLGIAAALGAVVAILILQAARAAAKRFLSKRSAESARSTAIDMASPTTRSDV